MFNVHYDKYDSNYVVGNNDVAIMIVNVVMVAIVVIKWW